MSTPADENPTNTWVGVPLTWHQDVGYRCPHCYLFVAVPRAKWAICPRCPGIPVEEAAEHALRGVMDEGDAATAIEALEPLLTALVKARR